MFQSPDLTALIDKVLQEPDYQKAKAIWKRISKYLYDHYTDLPIVNASIVWAVSKKVGEWPTNMSNKPQNLLYIRHAKPLKTYRLFEIE